MTSAEYDELGRRVRSVNADLTTRSTVYDVAGNVRAEIDERGNRTEHEYDAQNRRVLTRSAVGDESLVSFDAVGNRETATDGRGNVTTFEYDANRRQIATLFADGYRTRTVVDFGGRVVLRLDQRNVPTRYEYDGVGRLVAVVDALGGRTTYGYDQLGNRVSQTDANLHTTRFGFDPEGRMVSRTLPLGQRESLEYDAEGNQTAKVTFKGDRLEYDFDSNGRMIRKRVPGYSEYVLTYTATGQRESVLDYRGLTSYAYDSRDRLLRVDNPEGTFVSYTYDPAGNRATVTSPSQTVGYTYYPHNRMEHVLEPGGGVFTYSYDRAGNQIGLSYPNGVAETRTYDVVNRLLAIDAVGPFGVVTSFHYTLDETGRRRAVQEHNSRNVVWEYDDLYRLTAETDFDRLNGGHAQEFVYDPIGNRVAERSDGRSTVSSFDWNDRLVTRGHATYEWDDLGNQLTSTIPGGVQRWDAESRLDSVDFSQSSDTRFQYDIDGVRVLKETSETTREHVIDQVGVHARVLEERGEDALEVRYIYGTSLLGQHRQATSYSLGDGLGSVRALSDATGLVTDSYSYSAYGSIAARSGATLNDYLFAGEQFDSATQLQYLRARYFDPKLGRFVSQDPTIGFAGYPFSLSRYAYAHDNPVSITDPTGRFGLVELGIAVGVVGILSQVAIDAGALHGVVDDQTEECLQERKTVLLVGPGAGAALAGAGLVATRFAIATAESEMAAAAALNAENAAIEALAAADAAEAGLLGADAAAAAAHAARLAASNAEARGLNVAAALARDAAKRAAEKAVELDPGLAHELGVGIMRLGGTAAAIVGAAGSFLCLK